MKNSTGYCVLAVQYRGTTNLVEPLDFSFGDHERGSRPHDQASEGKSDRRQEDAVGADLRIW